MTREERALKNLKQMCSDGRYLGSGSYVPLEVLEDFEVAIKALKQEPTTKNDCETCIHNKGVLECDMYGCKYEPTTKDEHHRQNIQAYAHDFGVSEEQAEKELKVTTKNDLALIHTEGLDEEIRCTMCTNSMKNDRGCDGSCVVNKDMYKAVMGAIEKRIQPTTKNCESCRYYGSHHEVCNYCFKCSLWTEQEPTTKNDSPKYCDRNICLKNEYNNIGCEDCEVSKSQEPTTKNDLGVDCISRQEVLDLINADWKYENLEIEINNLTPVTPQPRKGHWIEYSWNDNGLARWGLECDQCHKKYKYGGEIWNNPNFCPNCGSDNREVEE